MPLAGFNFLVLGDQLVGAAYESLDGGSLRLQAEATAVSNGIALERMLVERMPEMIAAAASQLSNANITVLEGATGMSELVAGLASQGGAILAAVRKSLVDNAREEPAPSAAAASASPPPAPAIDPPPPPGPPARRG